MSIDPYGTIRAQIVDLQGNAIGGQVSNNDWRLIVDNEQLLFQHYDATANSNAGAYITRQSFGTGLTGISVVPLGTYSITGNLQVTDDLTVDGGTLFVDSSSNRVGFGTLTPSQAVHIVGNAYVDGDLTVTGNTSLSSSSLWTKDVTTNEIYYTTANVGIGTNNPDSTLHVNGTSKFGGNMTMTGHIIPSADNTYDLGSATNTFRHVYVGPGSLYVNGKQVITDDSDTITISTDVNQNLSLKTSGTGNMQISTVGSGDIELTAGGIIQMKKTLQILDGQKITSSGSTTVVCGSNFQAEGSLRGVTLTLDGSNSISAAELNVLDGATAGTGVASKAVVLSSTRDISNIRNLALTGDLTVSGTTTTVNSTTVAVADGMFQYAANNAANATDFGWYGKYVDSNVTYYSGMFRDATDNKMRFFTSTQVEPATTVDTGGTGYAKADVVVGDVDFTSGTMRGHIIPDTDNTYDIGSSEFKIRDMFVSESSLWVGDNHKITIDSGGKMKFRKRKTTSVPAAVVSASGLSETATATAALSHSGKGSLGSMKLKHWKAYMRTLSGQANAKIKDIFRTTSDDYDEEQGADSWLDSGNNVYLGASGNVGIGDSTPTEKLEVNGAIKIGDAATTGDGTIKYASGDFLGRKAGSWVSLTAAGGSSVWTEASNEAYYTTGNVGIGTNNPSNRLHVYANSNNAKRVLIQNVSTGTSAISRLQLASSGTSLYFDVMSSNYNSTSLLFQKGVTIHTGTDATGGLTLAARSGSGHMRFMTGGENERITIDSSGNVGIGDTTPSYKLDVDGDINLTGDLRIDGVVQTFGGGSSVWSESSNVASYANKVLIGNNSGGGLAAPGVGTYGSAGQRLVLWYANSTSVPYGMGMNGSTMWSAVPTDSRHEFYVHTSRVATFDVNGLNLDGDIRRRAHNSGYQVGLYNTEANGAKTNPIFTIGTNYKPTNTTLENMYGIGYSSGSASFINGSGWGMYVAAGGVANIFFGADVNGSSYINTTGNFGLGTNNPQYRLDVVGTARISSDLTVAGNLTVSGTTTTVSSTTITVADTLLALASNNVENVNDIGFYGKYVSSGTKYSGFARDATDGIWKLFQVDTEPTTTVDLSGGSGNSANYPPQNMTSSSQSLTGLSEQNGTYTVTVSTATNTTTGYSLFDGNTSTSNSTMWMSNPTYNNNNGSYTGSVNLTGGYTGEWVKLQMPTSVIISQYDITVSNDNGTQYKRRPKTFKLFGSSDNSTWVEINSQTNVSWSNGETKNFSVSSNANYTYFALVVNGLETNDKSDRVIITELNFVGQAFVGVTYGTLKVGTLVGDVTGNVTGDITGTVTGNVTGTAATVTGAAQTAITSVGNLTSLKVNGNIGIGVNAHSTINLVIGDSDTGFNWISDGKLAIYTNNQERMRFTDGGEVGIGNTAPTEKLDVRTTAGAVLGEGARLGEASVGTWISDTDYAAFTNANVKATGASYALLQQNEGSTYINTAFTKKLYFRVNNEDKMTISGDNVGIGNTNPSEKLDVVGNIKASGSITSAANTASQFSQFGHMEIGSIAGGNAIIGHVNVVNNTSAGYALWQSGFGDTRLNASNTARDISFRIADVEKMILKGDTGNVGIGTDSPDTKLHLANGDIRIAGTTSSKGGIEIIPMKVTTQGGGRIFFREQNDDNYGFSVGFNGGQTNDILNWGDNTFNISSHNNSSTGLVALSIERVTGNVGIPNLDVSGTGRFTGNLICSGDSNIMPRLESSGSNIEVSWTFKTADVEWKVGLDNNNGSGGDPDDFIIKKTNNGVPEFLIKTNGNVGIGNTNPDTKLHVNGNVLIGDEYNSDSKTWTTTADAQLILGGSHNSAFNTGTKVKLLISGYDNDTNNTGTSYLIYCEDENGNDDFWIKGAPSPTGNTTAYFRGNVGIGNTNPAYKLDVDGTGRFTGSITVAPDTNTTSQFGHAELGSNISLNGGAIFGHVNVVNNTSAGYALLQSGFGDTRLNASNTARDISFRIADVEKMILKGDTGNVGIGTTTPTSKLHVTGDFQQTNSLMNFIRMQLPMSGVPQGGTHKGYIILGKADVTGSAIPASYAIGKIIMRRGTHGSGHNLDVYNVTSSRGWNNEVLHVNLEFDGTSNIAVSRFDRLVKCTYNSIVYHAIETASHGGDPTTERIFEGYAMDAALVFVDATYVSSVTAFGTIGMTIEGDGDVGIGLATPVHNLHLHESSSASCYMNFSNDTTGATTGDGLIVGLNDNEEGVVWLRENNNLRFATNNTERMRITSAGRLIFGETSVTTENTNEVIQVYNKRVKIGGNRGHEGMKCHGNSNWCLGIVANSSAADCMNLRTGGSNNHIINFTTSTTDTTPVHAGQIKLTSDSTVQYQSASDRRIKDNIRDLANADALQIINNVQPRLYHYKKDLSQKDVYGFIAQEVAAAIPLWQNNDLGTDEPTETFTDEDGNSVTQDKIYTIDYARFTPLLVGSCKALSAENTELKAEVATLKTELAAIKAHLGL